MKKRAVILGFLMPGAALLVASAAGGQVMMSIPIPQDVDKATLVFDAGVKLLNKQNYVEAAAKFKEAARLRPTFLEAYFNEAIALTHADQIDEALSVLDKVLEMRPNFAKAYLQKGACLERAARYKDAKEAYESYLQLQPQAANVEMVRNRMALMATEANRAPVKVSSDAPDYLEETAQNGLARWPADRMPLKVYIADGSKVPHYEPQYADIVRQAFSDWFTGSPGKVEYKLTDDPSAADIQVTWTNDPKELMTPLEGGHALVSFDGNKVVAAKIILLTIAPDGKPLTERLFRHTVLHEIGHALGLTGHSSFKGDVMFAMIDREQSSAQLTSRDHNTLAALYAADDSFVAKHPMKLMEVTSKDQLDSPLVKATKLNAEGIAAMQKNEFDVAEAKFNEALKVKPNYALVESNLGVVYAQRSNVAIKQQNYKGAVDLLKTAMGYWEHTHNVKQLKVALPIYASLLEHLGQNAEAKSARARLVELGQ